MDAILNFELFKKELKKLLTREELGKSKSWISQDGDEVRIENPHPLYPLNGCEFVSLGSPTLAARKAAHLIKALLKK